VARYEGPHLLCASVTGRDAPPSGNGGEARPLGIAARLK
jgi:hypothetical protein